MTKFSILSSFLFGLENGNILVSLKMSENFDSKIILFIICVICGAILSFNFCITLFEIESWPVLFEFFSFVMIFLVSVTVMRGNSKVLSLLGMRDSKSFIGSHVLGVNVFVLSLILLMKNSFAILAISFGLFTCCPL